VTVDVAVTMPQDIKWKKNKFAGKFVLMVDDVAYVSVDFGDIKGGDSMQKTLTARVEITNPESPHKVALKILRPMTNIGQVMPTQYIDNFRAAMVVDGPPEPQQPYEEEQEQPEPLPTDDDEVIQEAPTKDIPAAVEENPSGEQTPDGVEPAPEGTEETPSNEGISDEEANMDIWVNLAVPRNTEALS
jgi:hypothetical protein